jgi:uncharacterized protein YegP (UPF0339 family)
MPDAQELWEYIERYKPTILTGVPEYLAEEATKNKIEWVAKNFGTDVPVITCKSKDKSLHAKPGDIIIDDWEKYKHKWVAIGGIWITHVNAKQSIKELKQHIKE